MYGLFEFNLPIPSYTDTYSIAFSVWSESRRISLNESCIIKTYSLKKAHIFSLRNQLFCYPRLMENSTYLLRKAHGFMGEHAKLGENT